MSLFLSCLVSFFSFRVLFFLIFSRSLYLIFISFHFLLSIALSCSVFFSLSFFSILVYLSLSLLVHIPISLSIAFVPLSPVCLYFSLSLFLLFVYLANSGEEENNPNRFHSHVITRQEQYGVKKWRSSNIVNKCLRRKLVPTLVALAICKENMNCTSF